MDNVLDWLNNKPAASRVPTLLTIAVLPLIVVVAVSIVVPAVAPIAGCAAGVALFVAAYGYWHTCLSPETREETNLKARFDLKPRRIIVGAALAVWLIVLLLGNSLLPGPLLGTLNVFVAICLYWVWRATPQEAAEALARWEAHQAAKEAEAAAAEAEDDPFDPNDPDFT